VDEVIFGSKELKISHKQKMDSKTYSIKTDRQLSSISHFHEHDE
jgi:hypothetical protein